MEYFDIILGNNIDVLHEAAVVVIHGASDKGKRLFSFLQWADIRVDFFCDQNAEKIERVCNRDVYTCDKAVSLIDECEDNVYVIACMKSVAQSYHTWNELCNRKGNKNIRFLSEWAVWLALYFNREEIYSKNDQAKLLFERENAHKSIWMNHVGMEFLMDIVEADEKTVWLLQPGKVGSTSLRDCINDAGTRCIQSHTVEYPVWVLGENYRNIWESFTRDFRSKKIKIIGTVREPIARDYSAFWQAFTEGGGERIRLMQNMTGGLQELYDRYVKMLQKGNKNIRDTLGMATPWTWCNEFEWFEEQYHEQLGINLYDIPFNKEKGYLRFTVGTYDIFILQLEKMENAFEDLKAFLENDSIKMIWKHKASDKWFSLAYGQFRDEVRIPREYFDGYYYNNKMLNHFYSEKDIEDFKKKWIKQVR